MFGAFFYSYCPVFIITFHLLFLKAHFLVKPNASLLGKICSPAGRRITTWPCLGIPKKSIAGLAIFSLKKINIWAGYLAWARRATARPVNTCSDVFVVVQRRKLISGLNIKKLCSAHTSKTQILLKLLGPSCRPLFVQFSHLLTTPSFPVYNAQFKNLTNQGIWRVVEYFF